MKCSALLVGLSALLLQACANAPHANTASVKNVDVAFMGDCRRIPKDQSGRWQRNLSTSNARCFSKADLERADSFNISDALRKLDPSIQ